MWVAPFGHPRITAPLQLPWAFRSLARPSSPLIAEPFPNHVIYLTFKCIRSIRSKIQQINITPVHACSTMMDLSKRIRRMAYQQSCRRGCVHLIFPRKEVIQPHLPIRLPCYDLVPLTGLTFGAYLLAVGTATSGATNSGGLTGGVYKAQEHIHRGVADPRLLAIPASCRRIAAYNPN